MPTQGTELPECTVADPALTQVLCGRGLEDQFLNLLGNIQCLVRVKVSSRQLIGHSVQNGDSSLVQLLWLDFHYNSSRL